MSDSSLILVCFSPVLIVSIPSSSTNRAFTAACSAEILCTYVDVDAPLQNPLASMEST